MRPDVTYTVISPAGAQRNDGAYAAYRNCLAGHGVIFPTAGTLDTPDPKVAATQACAPLRPAGPCP
jgi:hypothetical protein